MCLSSIYVTGENKDRELLCKNIAEVVSDGKNLRFIDVMGIATDVKGSIHNINLVDNYIEVNTEE